MMRCTPDTSTKHDRVFIFREGNFKTMKKGNYHRKRVNGKVRFIPEGKSEHKLTNHDKKSSNKRTKGDLIICETCEEPCWEFLGKIDDTGFNRYKRLECGCDYEQIRLYGTRLEWRE